MNQQVRVQVRFRDEAGNIIVARPIEPVTASKAMVTAVGGTLALAALLYLLQYALVLLV